MRKSRDRVRRGPAWSAMTKATVAKATMVMETMFVAVFG
jgi:hypothetical protein